MGSETNSDGTAHSTSIPNVQGLCRLPLPQEPSRSLFWSISNPGTKIAPGCPQKPILKHF